MNDFWKKIKKKITTLSSQPQKEVNGSRNLIIFIAGSLGITVVLVVASLALYTADGTIQLDLSRPVSPQGGLSNKEMANFELFYSHACNKIHANEFNENSLSDEALKITDQ